MSERQRRWLMLGLAAGAALLIVGQPTLFILQQNDTNAAVAREIVEGDRRDMIQNEHAGTLSRLVAENARLIEQRAEDQAAFELKVCQFGNDAKRTAREDVEVALQTWMEYLRKSPHAGPLVDEAEAAARARLSTAEQKDHECSGNGTLGPEDYPPDE